MASPGGGSLAKTPRFQLVFIVAGRRTLLIRINRQNIQGVEAFCIHVDHKAAKDKSHIKEG